MRRSYSQAKINRIVNTTAIIGDQYNLLIFFELNKFGEKSFNELKRMTQINAVTLTRKLRFLEQEKLIQKRSSGKEIIYSLTPKTNKLKTIIEDITSLIEKEEL